MRTGSAAARGGVAVAAIVAAGLTAALVVTMAGGAPRFVAGAAALLASVVLALARPALTFVPVVGAQLLVGGLLLLPGGPDPLALVPVVAGLVLTAELLGVAARLDLSIPRSPVPDLARGVISTLVGAAAFVLVIRAGELPGPSGLLAVGLAAAACAAVAVLLVRGAAGRR